MANCHDFFIKFSETISLSKTKREALKKRRDANRTRIQDHFKEKHEGYDPKFWIQGSRKNGTSIVYKDGTCDLDDGVYFLLKPDVTGTTLQNWVYDAVCGYTENDPTHKKRCIRVNYKDECNIDIPVLYQENNESTPKLAVKNQDWADDDPKAFVDWYKEKKTVQLTRIIKNLKAWCNERDCKTPNGMCMTILAEKHFVANDRDDIAIRDLLTLMHDDLNQERHWKCNMPTFPYDDLFLDYSDIVKRNFLDNLKDFRDDAITACDENSLIKATKLWQGHLGSRFDVAQKEPDAEQKSKLEGLSKQITSLVAGTGGVNSAGKVVQHPSAKPMQPHRNYGEEIHHQ